MGVDNLADRHFPVAGCNRGFSAAMYIRAYVLMRMEGGRDLDYTSAPPPKTPGYH